MKMLPVDTTQSRLMNRTFFQGGVQLISETEKVYDSIDEAEIAKQEQIETTCKKSLVYIFGPVWRYVRAR